ncbi:hypothetical protein ALC62_10694 [Cyphomyrmex costatus]|uniref:Uncharacterized protein n=1 Tax=Cyphomyrmex costatus TaxID=456900 RepID=A0A195CES4_9HYME|nr:hypothetical protein ALC62_10694 [Cyphomyrmex costatus]
MRGGGGESGAGKRVETSFAKAYFQAPSARTDRSPLSRSQYTPPRAGVTAVSWHPHGTYLASVDRAKTVTVWGDHV